MHVLEFGLRAWLRLHRRRGECRTAHASENRMHP